MEFMEEKKLWQKISGSITFYLRDSDMEKSNEELLCDYLDYVLPNDIDGVRRYLDKQALKYVEVSKELEEKALCVFIERLNKRRAKEETIEKVEKKEYKNNVISFESYKEDGQIKVTK
ncbi:TPA: hypothetical protein SOL37_004094 [Clostridioides difficile]|uniref:hypothetical protein n=1 Tax=Clostridioides difficile TaxID=1496 RepID=UPI001C1520C5|nr:hypothetical protein [Clostridioides difficile]HBG3352524.1 hypothetical protein [Clostridioides difficile]HBH3149601.1 hypothetical protein [Clostridioides difficile]HEK4900916.1 hypothetical protein [Clostridioides difficile]